MFGKNVLRRILGTPEAGQAPDGATLQALLRTGQVGIISAACCDAMSSPKDEQLINNLSQAMASTGGEGEVIVSTITATRQQLRAIGPQADAQVETFKDELSALFQTHGLGVFPLLVVDGRIAFYGGVPSPEAIAQRLHPQALQPRNPSQSIA
ncbi:MAG: hypothetical protein HY855_14760 [Burkholderiales bacterium]|nr:hypothetical protein [Burkholderiales bacterium]